MIFTDFEEQIDFLYRNPGCVYNGRLQCLKRNFWKILYFD